MLVKRTRAKEFAWPNNAPEDAAVEMDAGDRAIESVDGVGCANTWNEIEHPVEYSDLCETGDDRDGKLQLEKNPWRDFHVVAKLEVGGELQTLGGGDVAKCCKDHIGNRTTGKYDSADQLADEVDAALLVRNGHDNANGNEEDCPDAECQQKTIPRQMDRIVFDNEHADGGHAQTSQYVPGNRYVFVSPHQPVVYVLR